MDEVRSDDGAELLVHLGGLNAKRRQAALAEALFRLALDARPGCSGAAAGLEALGLGTAGGAAAAAAAESARSP